MIDFSNGSVFKLSQCNPQDVSGDVAPLLIPGEQLYSAFTTVRASSSPTSG